MENWPQKELWEWIENIMGKELDWKRTTGAAKTWWETFLNENKTNRPALVARLCSELADRRASVSEFFLAYAYSGTDNIQANLHYLDYTRLKTAETTKKNASNRERTNPKGEVEQILRRLEEGDGPDEATKKVA